MKKATVEIQMNWIYIGVVGALILLVFVNIAGGIRKSAQENMEFEAIQYFDEIFTSMQGSENTEHSITLPGLDIEFDTAQIEDDQCGFYRIAKSDKEGQSIAYLPVFGPNLIKKKVLSYSLGWDVPFRANYFLFLSSPDIAYVFVDDKFSISDDFPNHLNIKQVASSATFINQNYYKVKYIFFNEEPGVISASVAKLKDSEVSAVNIRPDSGIYGMGEIDFYRKRGKIFTKDGTSFYLDKPTLFAAIYAESRQSYECNLIKAIERINMMSKLLKDRVMMIKSSSLLSICSQSFYDNAYSMLGEVEQVSSSLAVDREKIEELFQVKNRLQQLNTDINRKSCPTIY